MPNSKESTPEIPMPAVDFEPSHAPVESELRAQGKAILEMEALAINAVAQRLDEQFDLAVKLLSACAGKVVVTGMGKSGHIATKLAATFASTGTPAFFVHPAELRHGDFGMLDEKDVVVALSGSGETTEIKLALDPIKRLGIPIVALTGNKTSTLAKHSNAILDVGVAREACPLNLAPTSSTTAALAMGDALAMVLMSQKGFRAEDFARSHPGGSLGQQLITVADLMRPEQEVPTVHLSTIYGDVLAEIDKRRLGFTSVCDDGGTLQGIITDGDLRRTLVNFGTSVFDKLALHIMTRNPKTISSKSLAVEALRVMEKHAISDLLIVDDKERPIGLIHLKDLLKAGII
ncbi:MAG TPA: KpsF/GutQ family sugar-phosphate isomerase [Drouetiella sp.]|jgi:arabinose-5-phosphate isomerase